MASSTPWLEVTPGLFVKPFGHVWQHIHAQHLDVGRVRWALPSSVMHHFYAASIRQDPTPSPSTTISPSFGTAASTSSATTSLSPLWALRWA